MGSFKSTILTQKAHALMAKLTAGTATSVFTKIKASDHDYSGLTSSQLEGLMSIEDIKQEVSVSEVKRINDASVKVTAALVNTALTTGYYIKTIGLYANDPDEGEILYSVTVAIESDWMPPFNNISSASALYELVTTVSNAENVSIEVDPNATVSITQFNEFKESVDSQLSNMENKQYRGDLTKISDKYLGSSIYIPYTESANGTFENNVTQMISANCNTIAICPLFWMDSSTANTINGYKSGTSEQDILAKCQYAKQKGLTVLLKPMVAGNGFNGYGYISPTDISSWINSYATQVKSLFMNCKDYVDIISITNECSNQTNQQETLWEQLITDIRGIKSNILITNACRNAELNTNVFLDKLDFLGCNMYVGVSGGLSTDLEIQKSDIFTKSDSLNNLLNKAKELGKQIIITEVGILPYEESLATPETWLAGATVNYEVQSRYYQLTLKEYLKANNVKGTVVWNSCDGFSFLNSTAQDTVKQIYGGEI